jgi:hypothetical protein
MYSYLYLLLVFLFIFFSLYIDSIRYHQHLSDTQILILQYEHQYNLSILLYLFSFVLLFLFFNINHSTLYSANMKTTNIVECNICDKYNRYYTDYDKDTLEMFCRKCQDCSNILKKRKCGRTFVIRDVPPS